MIQRLDTKKLMGRTTMGEEWYKDSKEKKKNL